MVRRKGNSCCDSLSLASLTVWGLSLLILFRGSLRISKMCAALCSFSVRILYLYVLFPITHSSKKKKR